MVHQQKKSQKAIIARSDKSPGDFKEYVRLGGEAPEAGQSKLDKASWSPDRGEDELRQMLESTVP